jgi:hypothetical protein
LTNVYPNNKKNKNKNNNKNNKKKNNKVKSKPLELRSRVKIYIWSNFSMKSRSVAISELIIVIVVSPREELIQCIALHCIALHCIALHCIALHCTALHCIALHTLCGVLARRTLCHGLPWENILLMFLVYRWRSSILSTSNLDSALNILF